MDLGELELAAKIVYAICREHPELCLHSYQFITGKKNKQTDMYESYYECILCGHRYVQTKPLN